MLIYYKYFSRVSIWSTLFVFRVVLLSCGDAGAKIECLQPTRGYVQPFTVDEMIRAAGAVMQEATQFTLFLSLSSCLLQDLT